MLSSLVQTMIGLAIVLAVAILVGFRSNATSVEWLAAIGVLAMATFALVWLAAAMGLSAKSVESASNTPMLLVLLPFFGSGFVPTESMPAGLRTFAEYQPFTPVTDTLRGLLLGGPIGNSAVLAVAWCAGHRAGRLPLGAAQLRAPSRPANPDFRYRGPPLPGAFGTEGRGVSA